MLENAFFQFDEAVWGTLRSAEECCPGVYYLTTDSGSQFYVNEFYAVPKDYSGDIISKETLAYGTESNGFLLFELGAEGSGAKLVNYEIQRYKVKMGMALNATESLYCTALYAMTQYPEYFGGVLPPRYTPCGLTVRVKTVSNGIYFVETDQCKWLLALNYCIWATELYADLTALGTFCTQDLQSGEEATRYLFFSQETFPVFILLITARRTCKAGKKQPGIFSFHKKPFRQLFMSFIRSADIGALPTSSRPKKPL